MAGAHEPIEPDVLLVAAAIIAREGRYLIARRKPGTHLEGLWEFPGGKCESGESLEHSLLPQQAVRELVRIVKPGGRVVIIDKNQQRQPLSIHDPWEQWFSPDAVQTWLRADCEQIEVRSIRHGTNAQPTGLFLCWTARRCGMQRARAA